MNPPSTFLSGNDNSTVTKNCPALPVPLGQRLVFSGVVSTSRITGSVDGDVTGVVSSMETDPKAKIDGNLTNVKTNAKFDFGVAMLPAGKKRGTPTGGGNFYLFKKSTQAQQQAAFRFIRWITTPERAAQWGIDTGYVAVRPDAWQTAKMTEYVKGFPVAAVARDQLEFSVAELSTHDNQRVTKALNDGLQAALTGTKTPEQALKDAQREAERILKPYRK